MDKLPDHVEIDLSYFPKGIGPGGFSPSVMKAGAKILNNQEFGMHVMEERTWVVLWLLDHIDWDKIPEEDKRYYDR